MLPALPLRRADRAAFGAFGLRPSVIDASTVDAVHDDIEVVVVDDDSDGDGDADNVDEEVDLPNASDRQVKVILKLAIMAGS